ncbi:MAG: site-2 protease family protein [Halioglobus sp.]
MKWSWKIARLAGIDVHVHVTFFLLLYLVGISYWNEYGTLAAVVSGVGFILALFSCVILHELGHSLTARQYGIRTRNITLLPIGGVAALERMPEDPLQEIKVALAGPMVNFVIAAVLFFFLDGPIEVPPSGLLSLTDGSFAYRLMILNIFLGGFNLLPAFPMDGGRVLRAVLALRMDHAMATERAAAVGKMLALVMGLVGWFYNPFLIFIAVFIWFGASMENNSEQLKLSLDQVRVRDAMLKEFHTLSPEDNLAKAVTLTLAGSQKDFPVGSQGGLQKVLHHSDLIKGLQEHGELARISDLQLADLISVEGGELLETVLQRMQGNVAQMMHVTEGGHTIGLLNLENIVEVIKIHEALHQHAGRAQHGY